MLRRKTYRIHSLQASHAWAKALLPDSVVLDDIRHGQFEVPTAMTSSPMDRANPRKSSALHPRVLGLLIGDFLHLICALVTDNAVSGQTHTNGTVLLHRQCDHSFPRQATTAKVQVVNNMLTKLTDPHTTTNRTAEKLDTLKAPRTKNASQLSCYKEAVLH